MIGKFAIPEILRDSIKTSGMAFIQLFTGILVSFFVARALGPEALGRYVYIIFICSAAALVINPSIYASVNYFISTKTYTVEKVWFPLLVYSVFLGLLGSIITSGVYAKTINEKVIDNLLYFNIYLIVFSTILCANFSGLMYGSLKINQITRWNSFLSIAVLLTIISITKVMPPLNFTKALITYSVFQVIGMIGLVILSLPHKPIIRINMSLIRDLTRFGIAVYPGRLANFLSYRVDNYLIISMLGSTALGIYSISVSLAELIWQIPSSINLVLLPNISKLENEVAIKRTLNVSQLVSLLMIIIALVMALFSKQIINIMYGTDYIGAQIPFLTLLPGIVVFGLQKILEPFFQSKKKPHIPSRIAVVSVVINVFANIILIPSMGIIGAALSSSISYSIQIIALSFAWQQEAGSSWWKLFIPKVSQFSSW